MTITPTNKGSQGIQQSFNNNLSNGIGVYAVVGAIAFGAIRLTSNFVRSKWNSEKQVTHPISENIIEQHPKQTPLVSRPVTPIKEETQATSPSASTPQSAEEAPLLFRPLTPLKEETPVTSPRIEERKNWIVGHVNLTFQHQLSKLLLYLNQ